MTKKITHRTVTGHLVEFEAPPKVATFLRRLEDAVAEPKVTERELTGLAYSNENPFLDHTMFPGRGAVTKEVLADPAYRVMTDLLFRKRIVELKIDVSKIEARYSMTPGEAAAELGVTEGAIRQAIAARRIASWYRDGRHYLDPRSLSSLELTAAAGKKRS